MRMDKNKLIYTVRWKFLFVFLASTGITALILLLCFLLANYMLTIHNFNVSYRWINRPLRWLVNNVGSTPIAIVSGSVVFLSSYFWLSGRVTKYLDEILHGLQEMSQGRFDTVIPVKTSDEYGRIARQANAMAMELNTYLQQITFGLQEIATGQLEHTIPVKTAHKLGMVAESINQMTAQLNQSIQEERNAEKTKNDLITGVSHDLRTPLTSILGFLELIESDRYQDEVELRYYVNIAYSKALSLKKLTDDLFEYTRINNGLPLELAELDMVGFLRQLVEEFVPSLENAGMVCRIHAESDSFKIRADGDRLVRAYENLMTNAIRYGSAGKEIDIEVGSEEEEIVIRITNYGEPISERDLPFLFDRFYRVEKSRSHATGGTGLGLAITKSIIEMHDGNIMVYSNRRQTTFETRFPSC